MGESEEPAQSSISAMYIRDPGSSRSVDTPSASAASRSFIGEESVPLPEDLGSANEIDWGSAEPARMEPLQGGVDVTRGREKTTGAVHDMQFDSNTAGRDVPQSSVRDIASSASGQLTDLVRSGADTHDEASLQAGGAAALAVPSGEMQSDERASAGRPVMIITVPLHHLHADQLSHTLSRWVALPACDSRRNRGRPISDLMFLTGMKTRRVLDSARDAVRHADSAFHKCFGNISYQLSDIPVDKDTYAYGASGPDTHPDTNPKEKGAPVAIARAKGR